MRRIPPGSAAAWMRRAAGPRWPEVRLPYPRPPELGRPAGRRRTWPCCRGAPGLASAYRGRDLASPGEILMYEAGRPVAGPAAVPLLAWYVPSQDDANVYVLPGAERDRRRGRRGGHDRGAQPPKSRFTSGRPSQRRQQGRHGRAQADEGIRTLSFFGCRAPRSAKAQGTVLSAGPSQIRFPRLAGRGRVITGNRKIESHTWSPVDPRARQVPHPDRHAADPCPNCGLRHPELPPQSGLPTRVTYGARLFIGNPEDVTPLTDGCGPASSPGHRPGDRGRDTAARPAVARGRRGGARRRHGQGTTRPGTPGHGDHHGRGAPGRICAASRTSSAPSPVTRSAGRPKPSARPGGGPGAQPGWPG